GRGVAAPVVRDAEVAAQQVRAIAQQLGLAQPGRLRLAPPVGKGLDLLRARPRAVLDVEAHGEAQDTLDAAGDRGAPVCCSRQAWAPCSSRSSPPGRPPGRGGRNPGTRRARPPGPSRTSTPGRSPATTPRASWGGGGGWPPP